MVNFMGKSVRHVCNCVHCKRIAKDADKEKDNG